MTNKKRIKCKSILLLLNEDHLSSMNDFLSFQNTELYVWNAEELIEGHLFSCHSVSEGLFTSTFLSYRLKITKQRCRFLKGSFSRRTSVFPRGFRNTNSSEALPKNTLNTQGRCVEQGIPLLHLDNQNRLRAQITAALRLRSVRRNYCTPSN